jgi:hypothetical protein
LLGRRSGVELVHRTSRSAGSMALDPFTAHIYGLHDYLVHCYGYGNEMI